MWFEDVSSTQTQLINGEAYTLRLEFGEVEQDAGSTYVDSFHVNESSFATARLYATLLPAGTVVTDSTSFGDFGESSFHGGEYGGWDDGGTGWATSGGWGGGGNWGDGGNWGSWW